ncbi:MAG: translocation/assembly module TamB domain-containing protein, partial [Phormidesmis sp.]
MPDLDELAGEFTGVIELAGQSLALADVTADFNVQGEGWEWGAYTPPNDFLVSGDVQQGTLAVESVFVNAGETQIDLSGSGNMDRLTGRLTVEKLPVELASLIYPLPARVDGDLDLVTTFGGSLANPVVEGEATVVDAQVNEQPIEQVEADFTCRNAVLRIDSETAVVPTNNPITLEGTIPYALPFMTVQPSTEQIDLTAIVPNSSFEVINALTDDQVRWESGRGRVVVEVGGTLTEPVVAGQASFREGTIVSSLLEDDLTDLNGVVQFDLEQVNIQQLQASMGDGQLAVTGTLPLLPSGQSVLAEGLPSLQTKQMPPESQNRSGLAIALQNLPVDYSDILQATFGGRVFVTGAVLAPTVSGNVEIDNGQIQANRLLRQAGSINLPTIEEVEDVNPYRAEYLDVDPLALQLAEEPKGLLDRLTLQNFGLTFGDRLVIAGSPFYNISALGDITVSGPLTALQPVGTIELKSGWINLFSTQFRLDSGAPNTATFTPENGLNPFVDVVMTARVQDADVTLAPGLAGGFARAEINESPVETIGSVQYVNVQAVARGPASELSDSLILTSDSDRDQGELLALVGSGVFSGFAGASFTPVTEVLGAGSLAGFCDQTTTTFGL